MQKLPEKLSAAEAAIFIRMQELRSLPDVRHKFEAIREACKQLLKIQTQRLEWPAPTSCSPTATSKHTRAE